jgi:hypothetical protein
MLDMIVVSIQWWFTERGDGSRESKVEWLCIDESSLELLAYLLLRVWSEPQAVTPLCFAVVVTFLFAHEGSLYHRNYFYSLLYGNIDNGSEEKKEGKEGGGEIPNLAITLHYRTSSSKEAFSLLLFASV